MEPINEDTMYHQSASYDGLDRTDGLMPSDLLTPCIYNTNSSDKPRMDSTAVTKFAADVGEPGVLICVVSAVPTPQFYWLDLEGKNMTGGSDYDVKTDGESSTLEFYAVETSHYGTYQCVSHNTMGEGSFPLELLTPRKYI